MRWRDLADERCSIARPVSIIGDRWTLLILRDCFLRIRRFDHFEARLGITRHILADRLRKLVDAGVLEKVPYGERPVRHEYRLTQKGLDLYPVMMSIVHWGDIHTAGKAGRPLLHRHLWPSIRSRADLLSLRRDDRSTRGAGASWTWRGSGSATGSIVGPENDNLGTRCGLPARVD
ncbi:MAG: putative HTH-type transcriptional regulator [Rhodopila sp.]|nr:putative HTH-type transcriptional regulator [Rhodopila sp.]